MDTPITLSSTSTLPNKSDFLQLNYSSGKNDDSIISIDSSFERVPVSWGANNITFGRSNSNTSLTNIQKVSNWIKSIEGEEPKSDSIIVGVDNDSQDCSPTCIEPSTVTSMDSPEKDLGTDSKSVILFRCDFNKSVTAKTYYPPLNPFNRATPLINYFKTEKDSRITSTVGKISNSTDQATKKDNLKNATNKNIQKRLLLKRPGSNKLINYSSQINSKFSIENENSYCAKVNDEKSDGSSDVYEVPLSPESRKKELCSYLQLMNPADKKERFILQNRRSTRVRNLAAMQEKKKMERKIKESEEDVDLSEKEIEKCPTLKSFKELNLRVEQTQLDQAPPEEKTIENDFEKDIFCFPFPSKDLTEKVDDFDCVMSKLVPRFKRICKLKKIKLNAKVMLKKSAPKNKENLIKNIVRTKCNEMNLTKNIKSKKISNVKNNITTKKGHKLKEIFKKKYKKPLTQERSPLLRSTGKMKNVTLRKLIGKKDKELKIRKNLSKKQLKRRQQVDKAKIVRPRKNSSVPNAERDPETKTPNPQCEIVTVTENNEDHVDLENFMDDIIDFNNLSEEHKKCLIESRILSTKPMTRMVSSNSCEEDGANSFYSLQAISPLYGFNESDINEVKKICEVYKNSSLLKNCKSEVMQEHFLDDEEVKIENSELVDCTEYKTETPADNFVEKLEPPVIADKIEHEFIIPNDANCNTEDPLTQNPKESSETNETLPNGISLQEHDYAGLPSGEEEEENEDKDVDVVTVPNKNLPVGGYVEINPRQIEKKSKFELLPYNKSIEMKSLHRSLQYLKRKSHNSLADHTFARDWELNSPKQKSRKQSHYISINKENGTVLKAFYIDYNLIVCQEYVVSFWMQTPLGNVLGSQNMWIPRGQTQRLVLNSKCIQKESMEMVIAMETHVAYIELWTKEHKSEIREGPVADVFATVYFWKQRQNGLEKKVLQLENINGFADDVQYSVMKCSPKIIVSWHSANEDTVAKRTFIHAYQLAPDYQTVSNIYDIEPVDHYVSSLHNIEDCDNLIMGCGENKITLWNVEYGYIVATIELSEIKSPLSTLWVKCDRGFLFALQQCVDRELRLIAINGINHSWKKLASYNPPEGFDRLRGVCIDNGLLLSFYDQGILCWKAETGEPVEETNLETEIIPSGKYVILMEDNQILVKHAITHLMSMSIDET